jgi:hypothetical protein
MFKDIAIMLLIGFRLSHDLSPPVWLELCGIHTAGRREHAPSLMEFFATSAYDAYDTVATRRTVSPPFAISMPILIDAEFMPRFHFVWCF